MVSRRQDRLERTSAPVTIADRTVLERLILIATDRRSTRQQRIAATRIVAAMFNRLDIERITI